VTAPGPAQPAYPGREALGVNPPSQPATGRQIAIGHRVMGHVDQRIAAVCHLSIGFGIIVGVGFLVGIAINLVIWLRSKRSPVVEYHAEQAGTYQLTVFLINVALVVLWVAFAVGVMGAPDVRLGSIPLWQPLAGSWCLLTPAIAIWYFGTILYGLYGGLLVAAGKEFSYPIFGRWARGRLGDRPA
jgi:uncharacterized Tic20 family protein